MGMRAAPGRSLLPELKSCSRYFQPDNGTSLHTGLRVMLRQVLVQSIGQREQCSSSCFPLLTANPQEKGIYCGPISGSALHYTSASKIDAINVLCPSLRAFSKPLPRDHELQIPFLLTRLSWDSLDSGKWYQSKKWEEEKDYMILHLCMRSRVFSDWFLNRPFSTSPRGFQSVLGQ